MECSIAKVEGERDERLSVERRTGVCSLLSSLRSSGSIDPPELPISRTRNIAHVREKVPEEVVNARKSRVCRQSSCVVEEEMRKSVTRHYETAVLKSRDIETSIIIHGEKNLVRRTRRLGHMDL